jgi:hypothetical protein
VRSVLRLLIVGVICLPCMQSMLYGQHNAGGGTLDAYMDIGASPFLPTARAVLPPFTFINPQTGQEIGSSPLADSKQRLFHLDYGGGLAYSFTKHWGVYGDYFYIPVIRRSTMSFSPNNIVPGFLPVALANTADTHYNTAGGGIQWSFPTVYKYAPFILLGIGDLHDSQSSTTSLTNIMGPSTFVSRNSDDALVIRVGGGLRYFPSSRSNWGIRIAVEGFYIPSRADQLQQPVPAIPQYGAVAPTIARSGFVRVTIGPFFEHRK